MTAKDNQTDRQSGLGRILPILNWLPQYERSWLRFDIIAGLTLWGLIVPEAMAYAGIAGLPPQAGLYTLVAALLVYALLGTSRHLSSPGNLSLGCFTRFICSRGAGCISSGGLL